MHVKFVEQQPFYHNPTIQGGASKWSICLSENQPNIFSAPDTGQNEPHLLVDLPIYLSHNDPSLEIIILHK